MKTFKEFLAEQLQEAKLPTDTKSVEIRTYEKELRKLSLKDLRAQISSNKQRIVDVSGFDKAGAVYDLLSSKYSEKDITAAFGG